MKILSVASEVFPLVKTGGLADVAGVLPAALAKQGVKVITLMPGYPAVMTALENYEIVYSSDSLFGGAARLLWGKAKGLELFVLDAPHLYDRQGNPYLGPDGKDWPDNSKRFAALATIAAEIGRGLVADFVPEIIHCHDWQAGLVPAYARYGGGPKTIMTVHNLAFQGHYPASIFGTLGLPAAAFSIDGVEYFGGVGYLKAGLQCCDAITTVSPTYAHEIMTVEDGMGLDGLLRARSHVVHGIVNGIDTDIWNPADDANIAQTYTAKHLAKRETNKRAIEKRFGLESGDGLLYCIVSRLTLQKGIDLVASAVPKLMELGGRIAILGSGDAALESSLKAAMTSYPGRVGIATAYDEPLSHLLQAGSDAILIPSRFEPCGLTQLYGLRYGCVPVVARVGGLADTVVDANDAALSAHAATGIQFSPVTQEALEHALERTSALYADKATWASLQQAGMKSDVSWTRSAARYAELYRALLKGA
ncbi:MAG: glycogen synthase GlgA [Aestuariivirga sp.]|nr:glycogen synthase GlgA [Aestuariivirga sp.]